MGFYPGPFQVTCDKCGVESEPVDTQGNIDEAAKIVAKDGWGVEGDKWSYVLTCDLCIDEERTS